VKITTEMKGKLIVKARNKMRAGWVEGVVVERCVRMPGQGGGLKELVARMKVGDSVVVPDKGRAASLRTVGRRIGAKMAARPVGEGQMRVWRVR
jgi:hypothetical protein